MALYDAPSHTASGAQPGLLSAGGQQDQHDPWTLGFNSQTPKVLSQGCCSQEGNEISMTDMAKFMAVEAEEDEVDEEDDPTYEPLSMDEESAQTREMVSHPHPSTG